MNELIAALILIVLVLWLLWDIAKHPSEYVRAYAELGKAMEAVKSEFALALSPTLEEMVRAMQRLIESAEDLVNALKQK